MTGKESGFPQEMRGIAPKLPLLRSTLLFAALLSVCAYPVLFVYFFNIKEAVLAQVFAPIIIFTAIGLASWIFFGILSGNMAPGAFIAAIFMLVFMNYALIDSAVRRIIPAWRWWRIAPACLVLLVNLALLLRFLGKRKAASADFTKITAVIGALFLILTAFNAAQGMVVLSRVPRAALGQVADSLRTEDAAFAAKRVEKRRNFYFFIFDEYSRQDMLKKNTGYDNSPFLKALESKKFNVSYSSRSPADSTAVSIGNSLQYSNKIRSRTEALGVISCPPLLGIFKKAGYKTYAYSPMIKFAYDLVDVPLRSTDVLTALSIEKTVLAGSFFAYLDPHGNEAIRADRLSLLAQAASIVKAAAAKPKFLFLHLLFPHEPFVFDGNGDPVAYENMHNWVDKKHYVGQLRFLSGKIDELTGWIRKSDPEAIVLMQSDHGARGFHKDQQEARACLNVLYLHGQAVDIEGLSTINTLRLALNDALGLQLEIPEN